MGGRAANAWPGSGELDVVGRGLQLVGGDGDDPVAQDATAVSATAPAVIGPLRLPPVPAPKGVTAVSPWIVCTSAMSTPSASATSCTTVVSMLFPPDPPATYTLIRPDGSMRIVAPSVP